MDIFSYSKFCNWLVKISAVYKSECLSAYFVDKTLMLRELFPYVSAGNRHICITRPCRFGKTIMANMISSFFQKIPDSGDGKNT